MKKYVLMLSAAGLIAAAPAYYAFQSQAQAKEAKATATVTTPASKTTATAKINCGAVPAGAEKPAHCVEAAAGVAADAATKASVKNTKAHAPKHVKAEIMGAAPTPAPSAPAPSVNE